MLGFSEPKLVAHMDMCTLGMHFLKLLKAHATGERTVILCGRSHVAIKHQTYWAYSLGRTKTGLSLLQAGTPTLSD